MYGDKKRARHLAELDAIVSGVSVPLGSTDDFLPSPEYSSHDPVPASPRRNGELEPIPANRAALLKRIDQECHEQRTRDQIKSTIRIGFLILASTFIFYLLFMVIWINLKSIKQFSGFKYKSFSDSPSKLSSDTKEATSTSSNAKLKLEKYQASKINKHALLQRGNLAKSFHENDPNPLDDLIHSKIKPVAFQNKSFPDTINELKRINSISNSSLDPIIQSVNDHKSDSTALRSDAESASSSMHKSTSRGSVGNLRIHENSTLSELKKDTPINHHWSPGVVEDSKASTPLPQMDPRQQKLLAI